MWNAICLSGPTQNHYSNLSIAINKLKEEIKVVDIQKLKKCSPSKIRRIKKAQYLLDKNENNIYSCIFVLVKINGLSKRTLIRTIKGAIKDKNKYYINYKYLLYIIDTLYKYIMILNSSIMDDLLLYSNRNGYASKLLTSRTIPIRKVLIKNEATAYIERRDTYLKNPYYQKKMHTLNSELDELDILF